MTNGNERERREEVAKSTIESLENLVFAANVKNPNSEFSNLYGKTGSFERETWQNLAENEGEVLGRIDGKFSQNLAYRAVESYANGSSSAVIPSEHALNLATQVYLESIPNVTVRYLAERIGTNVEENSDTYIGDLPDDRRSGVVGLYMASMLNRKASEVYNRLSQQYAEEFARIFRGEDNNGEENRR